MVDEQEIDDFLAHYGVKGMKWGKRKQSKYKPGATKEAKRVAAIQKKAKAGGTKALTTKELQAYNQRMDLERRYSQLQPSGKLQKGQKKVAAILAAGATLNTAIAFYNSPAGKMLFNKAGKTLVNKVAKK